MIWEKRSVQTIQVPVLDPDAPALRTGSYCLPRLTSGVRMASRVWHRHSLTGHLLLSSSRVLLASGLLCWKWMVQAQLQEWGCLPKVSFCSRSCWLGTASFPLSLILGIILWHLHYERLSEKTPCYWDVEVLIEWFENMLWDSTFCLADGHYMDFHLHGFFVCFSSVILVWQQSHIHSIDRGIV